MGNANQTFAPNGWPIASAIAATAAATALFVLRGGKTPAGFSERSKVKYYASMLASIVLAVFYLCVSLGSHFGHNLIAGHWIPDGMWLAFGFANTLAAYASAMAFSAHEPYAWVVTVIQGMQSALFYMGARNSAEASVPMVVAILTWALWAVRTYYYVRWCTPSEEWQRAHGGGLMTWFRVWDSVVQTIYPIMYIVDVTYLNRFNDHERDPWIIYFVISSIVIHLIHTLLVNFVFSPDEANPPVGIWQGFSAVSQTDDTGRLASAGILRQDFAPNPANPGDTAPVPATESSQAQHYGGFHFNA